MNPQPAGHPRLVVFDQALQIGLPEIDRQHGQLIDELNRLIAAAQTALSSETLVDVLSNLGGELADHFRFEESLFDSLGLPSAQMAEHIAAHEEILAQYVELNLDLMNSLGELPRGDVLLMVRRWVTGHILHYDIHMRDFEAAAALLPGGAS